MAVYLYDEDGCEMCPNCQRWGTERLDRVSAELYCDSCGYVMQHHIIDISPEKRSFAADAENGKEDPSHVGAPVLHDEEYTSHTSHLGCTITSGLDGLTGVSWKQRTEHLKWTRSLVDAQRKAVRIHSPPHGGKTSDAAVKTPMLTPGSAETPAPAETPALAETPLTSLVARAASKDTSIVKKHESSAKRILQGVGQYDIAISMFLTFCNVIGESRRYMRESFVACVYYVAKKDAATCNYSIYEVAKMFSDANQKHLITAVNNVQVTLTKAGRFRDYLIDAVAVSRTNIPAAVAAGGPSKNSPLKAAGGPKLVLLPSHTQVQTVKSMLKLFVYKLKLGCRQVNQSIIRCSEDTLDSLLTALADIQQQSQQQEAGGLEARRQLARQLGDTMIDRNTLVPVLVLHACRRTQTLSVKVEHVVFIMRHLKMAPEKPSSKSSPPLHRSLEDNVQLVAKLLNA